MKESRRKFLENLLVGTGIAFGEKGIGSNRTMDAFLNSSIFNSGPFIPNHVASWWSELDDLLWPQKKIVEKIKKRAYGFAEAGIDTAINFGFHARFDFSNYFGQLHGYLANVSEELKKYSIRFMDHYSCNNVERPKSIEEWIKLSDNQRHHVLLFNDERSASFAQYEGYNYNDLFQVDIRNGAKGYSPIYQFRQFCYNNPGFNDMHRRYLQRLLKDVPMDGIQIDDMCNYAGIYVCGCVYCRERFKEEYGCILPPITEKAFWGRISSRFDGGNYQNIEFRKWLELRANSVVDHLTMVKSVIGNVPLMTCCSSSGPITLNALTLYMDKMAPRLDLFMLENNGITVKTTDWADMDAEAMYQKDVALKKDNAPAMAVSYSVYEAGCYLGWALSRFWGVANWSSTLNQYMAEDPIEAPEIYQIIKRYNQWEQLHSPLSYREGKDHVDVRIIGSASCRYNGWRDLQGKEHWDKISSWTKVFLRQNIGYRFVRDEEFSDVNQLLKERTPLILDGVGCVSDKQFHALNWVLESRIFVLISLPFGTHDEKGVQRRISLGESLLHKGYKNLLVFDSDNKDDFFMNLIRDGIFKPTVNQISGETNWALRLRKYQSKYVIHLLNTSLIGVGDSLIKDNNGTPILKELQSSMDTGVVKYQLSGLNSFFKVGYLFSPELDSVNREVSIVQMKNNCILEVDLQGLKAYGVIQ